MLEPLRPHPLDHALEGARHWLRAIAGRIDSGELRTAYFALRAVLHLMRDQLPLRDAVAFGTKLPLPIRSIYYDGFRPLATPPRARHLEEFLGLIERGMAEAPRALDPQLALDAVFSQLQAHVPPAAIASALQAMPPGLHLLFASGRWEPGRRAPEPDIAST